MAFPNRSGQITVATAGTAVAGPSAPSGQLFAFKAHPDNTDTVWVGNDGANDLTSSNGFPLDPGEGIVVKMLTVDSPLAELYFDADVSGEKICWFLMNMD